MRRRKAMFSDMNIVPYLDVMLVLLVIFMATTPMVQMGVNIDLPTGKSAPVHASVPVIFAIDKHGNQYLQLGDQTADRVQSSTAIDAWLVRHQIAKDSPIHLKADRTLSWQRVLSALLQVHQLGWAKISLITEAEE
jgi:biopolymer transport protein TolR